MEFLANLLDGAIDKIPYLINIFLIGIGISFVGSLIRSREILQIGIFATIAPLVIFGGLLVLNVFSLFIYAIFS